MTELNLTANDPSQERILEYLKEHASDALAEKINNGTPFEKDGKPLLNKKTLSGFMKYACNEAKKLADKGTNSACIDDVTVYGWAIHYFEEESIEGTLYKPDGTKYKSITKQKNIKKSTYSPTSSKKKEPEPQISIFDSINRTVQEEAPCNDTSNTDDENEIIWSEEEPVEADEIIVEEDRPTGTPTLEIKNKNATSPIYEKYTALKQEYPDHIITYRLGDFYEVFGDDAVTLSNEMELTLTSRGVGQDIRVPLIGFPYHVAERYFAKIAKNHSLVIFENDEDIQTIAKVETADNQHIDRDTGEVIGYNDDEILNTLYTLLGNDIKVII